MWLEPEVRIHAPDAPVRIAATDQQTTLFAELRDPHFTLLLFDEVARSADEGQHLAKIAQIVQERFPDDVQTRFVVSTSGASPMPGGTSGVLLDADHQAHKFYGARRESLHLIRPDGCIGFRGQPAEERPLLHYLEKIFRGKARAQNLAI